MTRKAIILINPNKRLVSHVFFDVSVLGWARISPDCRSCVEANRSNGGRRRYTVLCPGCDGNAMLGALGAESPTGFPCYRSSTWAHRPRRADRRSGYPFRQAPAGVSNGMMIETSATMCMYTSTKIILMPASFCRVFKSTLTAPIGSNLTGIRGPNNAIMALPTPDRAESAPECRPYRSACSVPFDRLGRNAHMLSVIQHEAGNFAAGIRFPINELIGVGFVSNLLRDRLVDRLRRHLLHADSGDSHKGFCKLRSTKIKVWKKNRPASSRMNSSNVRRRGFRFRYRCLVAAAASASSPILA